MTMHRDRFGMAKIPLLARACCAAALITLGACADVAGEQDLELFRQVGSGEPTDQPEALGVRITEVVANGTGCPLGSSHVVIDPDGKNFTITFDKYLTEITPATSGESKSCQYAIGFRSAPGVQYAVESIDYSGSIALDDGVQGKMESRYYIQGSPDTGGKPLTTQLTGPLQNTFLFTDKLKESDLTWTPCGVNRDINVSTRLQLTQGSTKGNGRIEVTQSRGLRIVARRCGPGADAGAPDTGTQVDAGGTSVLTGGLDAGV